jgi:hypothetical protein
VTRTLNTSYNRATGIPSLGYRLGLTSDPGKEVIQLPGATANETENRSLTLRGDVTVVRDIKIDTSFQRTHTRISQTGGSSQSIQTTWPDLTVNWGGFYRRFGLEGILGKTARASTGYRREVRESSRGGQGLERRETTVSWTPLLDLSTSLPNGVQLKMNSSVRRTESEQLIPTLSVTRRSNRQLTLDLSKRLRVTREVTIPLTGEKQTIQSQLDLAFGVEYRDEKSETEANISNVHRDTASLTFSARTGYEFTRNIRGEGSISLGQDTDRKTRVNTARHVSVFFTASFTF